MSPSWRSGCGPANICALKPEELDGKERKQVERWFKDYVQPVLSPMVMDSHHPFPHLPSKSLNIVLSLRRDGERRFGLISIPKGAPRLSPPGGAGAAVSAH